ESQRQLRNARKAELLPAIRTHESFLPIAKAQRLIPAMPNLQAVHSRSDQPDLSPGKWVVAVRHRRRQNENRELQLHTRRGEGTCVGIMDHSSCFISETAEIIQDQARV